MNKGRNMNVPMLDLVAQYKPLENNIKKIVDDVFLSKKFINGPQVTELEKILATKLETFRNQKKLHKKYYQFRFILS
jgi:hypothetical protein